MITFRTWRFVAHQIALTLLVVFCCGGIAPAAAQLAPYGGQQDVLVDMSVVNSGIGVQPYVSGFSGNDGGLLDPPAQPPHSQLLVSTPPVQGAAPQMQESRVTLTPPRPAATPRTKPATIPQKAAPEVAKAKAEPVQRMEVKPPAKPAVTPPKPEMAMAETEKAASTAAEKPAPLTVRAPPPPATSAAPATDQPPPMPKVTPPKPAMVEKKEPAKPAPMPEQASRTPAVETPSEGVSVVFGPDAATLPQSASSVLDEVTKRLGADSEMRLQLMAYAGGPSLSSSKARRLSLSRALAVRSYLIDGGIRSSRIDVRALGDKVPDGDPNRVDIRYTRR